MVIIFVNLEMLVSPTPRLLLKRGQMVENLSAWSGNYIPITVPVATVLPWLGITEQSDAR